LTEKAGMDPADLWRQWYEAGSRMWTGALQGNGAHYMDPWGLYRQWFEGLEKMRERTMQSIESGHNGAEASDMWKKSVDATLEGWRKSAEMSTEMISIAPRWMEMLDQARENLMAVERFPKDPLEFVVQWYNATSGPYSEFVQDVIEREEFLEQGSRFLQNYASLYKVFKRNSEEYLHNIQVPTRSDITRVASLVVNLEEKVDRVEEAVEDMQDATSSPADGEQVANLERRIERVESKLDAVEGKLDRLLAALENVPANGEVAASPAASEVKATEAARRKARDMNVDLSEVTGTGTDGQITVEDVRKKGEA
jgi:polyhydroxyalkanoic acid synthase PhaR subunit